MTEPDGGVSLAATYGRVAAHLVGRERELTLVLAAVAAGRDLILEGPLLDTSGEQDADLARELARLGHGRLRRIDTYTDVAPALSAIFAR